jgi:murein L,D-transpeptidase YcbB/YkuD
MTGLDRVAAITALALVLPLSAAAQETGPIDSGKLAAVPSAASSAELQVEAPIAASASPAPSADPVPPAKEPAVATEQKPDPLAALDPTDRVIAEKIRDLLATKSDRIFAGKRERAAVEAFYQNRNLAPLWLDKGFENARAKAVIARLKNADADGLEPGDYKTPNFAASGQGPDAIAEADLNLTHSVLAYARHVQAGRFPYSRMSRNIELSQAPPEPADVLSRVADAADAAKALDEFSPQNEPYRKLKAMLAQMRGKSGGARSEISDGPALSYNRRNPMEDPRVPLLRERLNVSGERSDLRYDARLADAVNKFQQGNDLPASGNLDLRTLRELNGPTHDDRRHYRQYGTLALVPARLRRGACTGQRAGFQPQSDARRGAGVDDADRHRQAQHADALAERNHEIRDNKSDLERAAFDRPQRIPSGAGAGPDGAVPHGLARELRERRRAHLHAARRQERAWPAAIQLPQPLPGLSARYPGQISLRA